MALGQNVNLSDKLIKNTTGKTSKGNKTNKESIARKANNTNITGIGKPSTNPYTATYSTKKMTFYVKDDLLKKLYNFAYWERHTITEAFNLVLADGLKGKNTKDKGVKTMPTKINDTLELYDLDELSKKLEIHLVTIQRYCRTGRIKAQKVGRSYKVTGESLRAFLNGENTKKQV